MFDLNYEIKLNEHFENLHQRILYNFDIKMPPFIKIPNHPLTIEQQRDTYCGVHRIYATLSKDPSIVGMEMLPDRTEDAAYSTSEKIAVRKIFDREMKKVSNIFDWLIACGSLGKIQNNEIVISKRLYRYNAKKQNILNCVGLNTHSDEDNFYIGCTDFPGFIPGIKYFSERCTSCGSSLPFRTCIVDKNINYQMHLFALLSYSPQEFYRLINYLESHNFKYDASETEFKLDIRKNIKGFSVGPVCSYHDTFLYQLKFNFVSDKNLIKYLLTNFTDLPVETQDIIFEMIKHCDKCGFCTQMNKSRPYACMNTIFKNDPVSFCTYFQKIEYSYIDKRIITGVIKMYDYIFDHFGDK